MTPADRTPILPRRIRSTNRQSFAFVPHRFLREGFLASLSADQQRLYFFLVLAADKHGMSFYHYDSICSLLRIPLETYLRARDALIDNDLIAFDGSRFQVLSLPDKPRADSTSPPPGDHDSRDDYDEEDEPLAEARQLAARRAAIRRDLQILTTSR